MVNHIAKLDKKTQARHFSSELWGGKGCWKRVKHDIVSQEEKDLRYKLLNNNLPEDKVTVMENRIKELEQERFKVYTDSTGSRGYKVTHKKNGVTHVEHKELR